MEASHNFAKRDLDGVFDSLPLAIAVIGPDRKVLLANQGTQRFVGQVEEQIIGKVGGDAFSCVNREANPKGCGFGVDCFRCKMRIILENALVGRKASERVETTMHFELTGPRHLLATTLPIVFEGKPAALLALEDVTETKAREEMRLTNERLAAAVKTGGAVCHEMNQPLTAMAVILDRLLNSTPEGDPRRADLLQMQKLYDRLADLTWKLMHLNAFETKEYRGATSILDLDKAVGLGKGGHGGGN